MSRRRYGRLSLSTVISSALLVAGVALYASSGAAAAALSKEASGAPLVFGVVATQTGASGTPEQGQAMQAYVANWNAHGGYKGRPIRLVIVDGGTDPSQTADAARQLVSQDQVIGMIQNYDLLDCSQNTSYYASEGVGVVDAESASSCYNPAVDFTTEKSGGTLGLSTIIQWGVMHGSKKFALIVPNIPGVSQLTDAMTAYAHKVHTSLVLVNGPLAPTAADIDAEIAQMKADHVTTVMALAGPALSIQEGNRQGFGPAQGIRWVFPSSAQTTEAAQLPGAYQLIAGYPWTSQNPQIVTARKLLTHAGVKLDSLSTEGYQAAAALQSTLETMHGPVTRSSFLSALKHDTKVPLALTPLVTDPPHPAQNPSGGLIEQSKNGSWVIVSPYVVVHE